MFEGGLPDNARVHLMYKEHGYNMEIATNGLKNWTWWGNDPYDPWTGYGNDQAAYNAFWSAAYQFQHTTFTKMKIRLVPINLPTEQAYGDIIWAWVRNGDNTSNTMDQFTSKPFTGTMLYTSGLPNSKSEYVIETSMSPWRIYGRKYDPDLDNHLTGTANTGEKYALCMRISNYGSATAKFHVYVEIDYYEVFNSFKYSTGILAERIDDTTKSETVDVDEDGL